MASWVTARPRTVRCRPPFWEGSLSAQLLPPTAAPAHSIPAGRDTAGDYNFGASITTPQPTNDGRTYVSADMGGDHVCALLASGAAFCGGRNANGQLGDGTTTDQPISVAVLGGNTYTAIAGGTAHTCGLTATGPPVLGR